MSCRLRCFELGDLCDVEFVAGYSWHFVIFLTVFVYPNGLDSGVTPKSWCDDLGDPGTKRLPLRPFGNQRLRDSSEGGRWLQDDISSPWPKTVTERKLDERTIYVLYHIYVYKSFMDDVDVLFVFWVSFFQLSWIFCAWMFPWCSYSVYAIPTLVNCPCSGFCMQVVAIEALANICRELGGQWVLFRVILGTPRRWLFPLRLAWAFGCCGSCPGNFLCHLAQLRADASSPKG